MKRTGMYAPVVTNARHTNLALVLPLYEDHKGNGYVRHQGAYWTVRMYGKNRLALVKKVG